MKNVKQAIKWMVLACLVVSVASPASAFLGNKFEKELEKEADSVKLVREIQRGNYDVVTNR